MVLASKDGKVIYDKAFGLANVEHGVPNKKDTRFGIASINKPMTFVVLAALIEQGKIAPTDKLSKYIPDFPEGEKITIEMIARHQSGISHRVMPDSEETKRFSSEAFVKIVKKSKLEFDPGTKRLYSSAGYAVLARTLEIASGDSFGTLLRKYVFEPAAMSESMDYDSRVIMKDTAECYLLGPKGYEAAPNKDYSFLIGAGSMFSTAGDVYRFAKAQTEGKFGELVKTTFVRGGVFSSNGSTNGYRANVRIDTNKNYSYVLVSNMAAGSNDLVIRNVRQILEGGEADPPRIPSPKFDSNAENRLEDYLGRYKLGGSGFDVLINDGVLYTGPFKMHPLGKDRFYNYFGYAEVTFTRNEKGQVTGLVWAGSQGKTEWTREVK